jgi:HEAT repeats
LVHLKRSFQFLGPGAFVGNHDGGRARRVLTVCAHFLPALLLFGAVLKIGPHGPTSWVLVVGLLVQLSVWAACGWSPRRGVAPAGAALFTFLLALVCVTAAGLLIDDWYLALAQGILLVASLLLFGHQVLVASGAAELRRAQVLASRLAARKNWPAKLDDCRALPEVKALREALQIDAAPALNLLRHRRPEIRVAALATLEFRKHWRRGQAETVLDLAQREPEPLVRATALSALANVDDPLLVNRLAGFLRDPEEVVRRAASEALLWDGARRWPGIRLLVRTALADASLTAAASIVPTGQSLPPEVLKDLTAWTSETGLLSVRSARTLSALYDRALREREDVQLIEELRRQTLSSKCPSCLRIELAHVLKRRGLLDRKLYEVLLDRLNPVPLRLLAAETLLEEGEHARAVAALREVARLPNREIALAIAALVQRRLGVEMGLPPNQPPPPLNSRHAAEITRRVMLWGSEEPGTSLSGLPSFNRS